MNHSAPNAPWLWKVPPIPSHSCRLMPVLNTKLLPASTIGYVVRHWTGCRFISDI